MSPPAQLSPPLPIDEALAIVLAAAAPLPAEDVSVMQAGGRFLAAPLLATIELPPFTNSSMDGYALRAADTPGRLTIVGESAAGSPFLGRVGAGEAVVISTGAMLPAGCDAIVPLEEVDSADGDDGSAVPSVGIPAAATQDQFVRHAGSDSPAGAQIMGAGTRLGPAQVAAAAAAGIGTVACGRLPRVAILTTGTELREPGQPLQPGQIYDANGPLLSAALARTGAGVTRIPAASDTPQAHREALIEALRHDVVISSGGVSVGPHDLVRGVGAELGVRELFWRIRMRPGKPLSFGVAGTTLVFGLPGNPVSTLVCFELFVRPALLALQGAAIPGPSFETGVLATSVRRPADREDVVRVRRGQDGRLTPIAGQASHQIASMAQADGLARIPIGSGEIPTGGEVAYLPLNAT
jgi:molybdopterin molybdotransferase